VSRFVRAFEIPDSANVVATYPIARVAGGREPDAAREFIARVLSAEGQHVLERHGLIPVGTAKP
jgi:molybdate transport system substrate-binding protein